MKKLLLNNSLNNENRFSKLILFCTTLLYFGGITICAFNAMTPLWFGILVILIYLCVMPKYLMSPINMITIIYFVFYFIAPMYAPRYEQCIWDDNVYQKGYFMIYTTYYISVVYSYYLERKHNIVYKMAMQENSRYKIIAISMLSLSFIFLYFYIQKTGGISAWQNDAAMAYLTRKGAGIYYLGFTLPLNIFSGTLGQLMVFSKKKYLFVFHILLMSALYIFIGSKGVVIQLLLLALGPFIMQTKLVTKQSALLGMLCVFCVLIGLYQRNTSWMTVKDLIPYTLDYFDVLEQFIMLLKDRNANIMESFLLPLNAVLLKFGVYISHPFRDLSVWLTSIYYPHVYDIGCTTQWPVEADLYLSFLYFGGLPFLMVYLWILNWLYKKAQEGQTAFIVIYIMEYAMIFSHYRSSILIWWYWYLIPFYLFVYWIFKTRKNDEHERYKKLISIKG